MVCTSLIEEAVRETKAAQCKCRLRGWPFSRHAQSRSKKELSSFENSSEARLGKLQPCVLPLPCLQPYLVKMIYVGVIRL
jgi:hypothetical protein